MKRPEIRTVLVDAMHRRMLVRLRRENGQRESMGGFVVAVGERWMLLHEVDGNTLRLNGYVAIRLKHVAAAALDDSFAVRALVLRGDEPVAQPDLLIDDLPGMLSSVNAHFPLVTIELFKTHPNTCFIGRVGELDTETVTLSLIDARARWSRSESFKLKDITQVQFGDGYSEALWTVGKDAWRGASPR
jgi:hypothetical protein